MKKIILGISLLLVFYLMLNFNTKKSLAIPNISNENGVITREEKILHYDVGLNAFTEYNFMVWGYGASQQWCIYNSTDRRKFSSTNPWNELEIALEDNEDQNSNDNSSNQLEYINHIKILIKNNDSYQYLAYVQGHIIVIPELTLPDETANGALVFGEEYAIINNKRYPYFEGALNYNFTEFDNQKEINGSHMKYNQFSNMTTIRNAYYFENLNNNFGDNNENICGYVAIASLLSYYNVLYNSDFINAERLGHDYSVSSTSNSIFPQDYPESPGYLTNFSNFLYNDIGKTTFSSIPLPRNVMTPSRQQELLEKYLADYTELSNLCTIEKVSSNILQYTISEIDAGRPVLMTMYSWTGCYATESITEFYYGCPHVVIVYGYKRGGDGQLYFKCHTGWKQKATSVFKLYSLNNVKIIKFNYDNSVHKCNNNAYIYEHKDSCAGFNICVCKDIIQNYCESMEVSCTSKEYYCPTCNDVIETRAINNHQCTWDNSIFSHRGTCTKCDRVIEGQHLYVYNKISELYKCRICGFTTRIIPANSNVIPVEWLKEEYEIEEIE